MQDAINMDIIEDVYLYNLETSKSPLLTQYYNKTDLWTLLKNSLKDEFILKVMLFNLDFNIAPLHSFVKYYYNELHELNLMQFDKQCIGYHVAIIFASLGYKKTRQIYRKDAMIKYAAYFEKVMQTIAETEDGSINGDS